MISLALMFLMSSEWMIRTWVEPNDNFQKALILLEETDKKNIAFGDSRIAFGFSGGPEFVNLGFQAETILDIEKRVMFYLKSRKPKNVIFQADPHMFSFYRLNEIEKRKLIRPNWSLRIFSEYHRQNLIRYWGTLFVKGTFDTKYEFRPDGWQRFEDVWHGLDEEERAQRANQRASVHMPIPEFESSVLAKSYTRTLDALLQSGAEVCLVSTPVSHNYLKYAAGLERGKAAVTFFRRLAESKGLKFISLRESYAQPRFNNYFSDADHMNGVGVEVFSNEVQNRCFG